MLSYLYDEAARVYSPRANSRISGERPFPFFGGESEGDGIITFETSIEQSVEVF